ncbi:MAG: MerR family transcriptional regulator, partial [Betaproteobacteria bacterium]
MTERAAKPSLAPLPPIPPKRYFTIGEVSELCGVKPH